MSLTTIILAAGFGKRMKSEKPKVLHEIAFKPLVKHVTALSRQLGSDQTVVVVGHGKEAVMEALGDEEVDFAVQENPQGTGHAVMMAESYLSEGQVLILCGDTPLLSEETLKAFVDFHCTSGNEASLISMVVDPPQGYGRIVRDSNNQFSCIVEQKDATAEEALITEVNSGIGLFDAVSLKWALGQLTNDNAQKEYYLTDVYSILKNKGKKVDAYVAPDAESFLGINDKVALAEADDVLQARLLKKHQLAGVTFLRPSTTYLGADVVIGQDTVVYPNCVLKGRTVIGTHCEIGPSADIEDTEVRNGVTVKHSTLKQAFVDDTSKIGPYAYLRPGSKIGKDVKIGDFVEVKNTSVGDHSKVSHLTYIGDGEIGENVNLGCGVVFVNYDGVNKHLTKVESGAFVGYNTNLVAPVTVGQNAYVAAGSTITEDVPSEALGIARARQINKTDWSGKYKKEK